MGRETLYGLTDTQYIRRDGGNAMEGPLTLGNSAPSKDLEATSKAYVDRLMAAGMSAAGVDALIAVLTAAGGTIDVRIAAAIAAYVPLAGGTMTGLLTLSGAPVGNLDAATKLYVDSLPVAGLETYDVSVAPAGGDYTSVAAACAAEAVGAKIFVKQGTYNETADIVIKDGQMVIGENPENTIIDWGFGFFQLTTAGAGTNIVVKDLAFQGGVDTNMVYLQGDHHRVENCRFEGDGGVSEIAVRINGSYGIIKDCWINDFMKPSNGALVIGTYCTALNNTIRNVDYAIRAEAASRVLNNSVGTTASGQLNVSNGCHVIGNELWGAKKIYLNGSNCIFVGNTFSCGHADVEYQAALSNNIFTGNYFIDAGIKATNIGCTHALITGNVFNSGQGIEWNGHGAVISGNTFIGDDRIQLTAGSYENAVSGNNLSQSTASPPIVDTGTHGNQALNNLGVPTLDDKRLPEMENTSGGALVAGDVVVLKAAAAGDEVTTTTIQGDPMVFGMLDVGINNAAKGVVQVTGKTTKLKVNGVVDIAIGDLLGTFTAAGIAMKAATGDMAFAVALEAYATDDSAGVIDALLIEPRIRPQGNYAGLYVVGNAVATAIDLINNLVPVTIFTDDMPEKVSNGAFGTNDVTIGENGDYQVDFHIAGASVGAAKEYSFEGFCITPTAQAITGATQASPCVVTATGHSFINGDHVKLSGIAGMVELNDNLYVVAAAGVNDFALHDENGVNINSAGYGAYAGPGIAELATEIEVLHMRRLFGAGGDIGSKSAGGIATLVGGETIELFVMNTTDTTDITLVDVQMSMIKI